MAMKIERRIIDLLVASISVMYQKNIKTYKPIH